MARLSYLMASQEARRLLEKSTARTVAELEPQLKDLPPEVATCIRTLAIAQGLPAK